MSSAVSLRPPAPPLLPGFASPPSSAGIGGALCNAANNRAAATVRACFAAGSANAVRPWVGHRLRRLCSAEERKARGPRAQRASCSDSSRLSERSERSSRSELRDGATRPSTAGDPACKAGRCIRSRRRWPTRGPRPTTNEVLNKSLASGRYAPQAAIWSCAIERKLASEEIVVERGLAQPLPLALEPALHADAIVQPAQILPLQGQPGAHVLGLLLD